MAYPRVRQTVLPRISGDWGFINQGPPTSHTSAIPTDYANCSDICDAGDCNPFTVTTRHSMGGVINKTQTGAFTSWFNNYICDWIRLDANTPHLSLTTPSDVEAATSAAARTNPSRAYVDVPQNVFDMSPHIRDLEEQVNSVIRGNFIRYERAGLRDQLRTGGSRHLEYSFLIAPVVSDIIKMAHAADQIERRRQEINRLFDPKGRGIRRTVDIGVYSNSAVINPTVQSAGTTIFKQVGVNTVQLLRCHCRWSPTTPCGLVPLPNIVHAWARQAVQGITIDGSLFWELIPWSWLADWFGNVGTYLKATRNIIPAQLVGVYPMRHTLTSYTFSGSSFTGGSISSAKVLKETKSRTVSFVAPYASLNFLSAGQMGILAALAASRL